MSRVAPTVSAIIADATSIGKALITGADQAACRATLDVYSTGVIDTAFLAVTNSLNAKADLVATKVPTAQLGSGTADSTTFLRGDQSWAAIDLSAYVAGPAGAVTDNAVVRWDATTGRLVKNSGVTISDTGVYVAINTGTGGQLSINPSSGGTSSAFLTNNSFFVFDKTISIQNAVATSAKLNVNDYGKTSNVGQVNIWCANSTTVGVILTAVASQTANLTEWQNNAGTVLCKINSVGKVQSSQDIDAWTLTTSSAKIGYTGPSGEGGITFGISGDAAIYRSGSAMLACTASLTLTTGKLLIATAVTPASATATGTKGTVCWDSSYVYVCTATNTWKRAALVTW